MTSKELPPLMEFVSHERASTAGNGSCPNFGHGAPAKFIRQYTAKRPRWCEDQLIQTRSSPRVGLFKRARGCSSKLPTLSLNILSEIFSYLHPSDLVSLNWVNKNFRSLLSSRNSSVIWNTCFKLCGAPASPADVSPRAWAHLLFGNAYCYSCGAKPENNILFSSRRRACNSCMAAHLLCSSHVPRGFRDLIRFEPGNVGSMVHRVMPCCTRHWWDEDVAAFEAELNVLKYPFASDGGIADIRDNVLAFLTRKKEEVGDIREHALICAEWYKDRIASRSPKSFDVGFKRSEYVNSPFLQLGCSGSDVDQLRWDREVRIGNTGSDRVQRDEPLLHRGVNEVGDSRANSYWQDQVALLDASARSSYQQPTGSRHEDSLRGGGRLTHDHLKRVMQASFKDQIPWPDSLSYQPEIGRGPQGNGGPDYHQSQFFTRTDSQDHVTQLNESSYRPPIDSALDVSASQYSTLSNALSLSVMPTQFQDSDDQVEAQPDEATGSTSHGCPVCRRTFCRAQERNRHVESHLPHSIYCPFHGCPWTGRRQYDFKKHWKKTHPNSGRVPEKTNEIYNPKKFVKSVVDGTPLAQVVRSACIIVQERLEKLGKVGVEVNVWGRKRKVFN